MLCGISDDECSVKLGFGSQYRLDVAATVTERSNHKEDQTAEGSIVLCDTGAGTEFESDHHALFVTHNNKRQNEM